MDLYTIREATITDIDAIVKIYNSNNKFLINHLGKDTIDKNFIINEMKEMKSLNFLSCVIVEAQTNKIIGVLDYNPKSTVYLSLMMINSEYQGNGIGDYIYKMFEKDMIKSGKKSIRIDVVNDYSGNAIGFWEKQGFTPKESLNLTWGNKESSAIVMKKNL